MRALSEPILDGGLRTTHFFNGRLLSAEDLALEQDGNREARRRLGRAIGDGVASGLEVFPTPGASTVTSPSVTVRAGTAINRRGHALSLPADADLSLVRRLDLGDVEGAVFRECTPSQRGVIVTGDGLYVLVIAPASATEGRAPVSGLGNVSAACNARFDVEGVQFRLVPVTVDQVRVADQPVLADPARLRNRAAHACFGAVDAAAALFSDPYGQTLAGYGLVDRLRADRQLTDCDVPLALLYWTARGGVQFVDNWAVRRRVTAPPVAGRWSFFLGDRRDSEAEAMFLQFQEQVDDMVAGEPDLTGFNVGDRFDVLPPLGIVPISLAGARTGFGEAFFDDRALPHVGMIDGARVRSLLVDSLRHEPIVLARKDRVQVYVLYENQLAVQQAAVPRIVLVFASATLPFRGTARFAYGRWNLARYGTSR